MALRVTAVEHRIGDQFSTFIFSLLSLLLLLLLLIIVG